MTTSLWTTTRAASSMTHRLRDGYFVETGRFTSGRAELTYGDVTVPVDVDALLD